jgi:hypothetical protein
MMVGGGPMRSWLWTLLMGWLLLAPAWAGEASMSAATIELAQAPLPPIGWRTVNGTHLAVHGRADDLDQLERVRAHGDDSLPRLADELGLPLPPRVHVFLAPNQKTFDSMQPGRPPTWADATAYPSLGAIYLRHPRARKGVSAPLEQVLDHELVHVVLGQAYAPNRPPRWLQEGVAQVFAGEHGPQQVETLSGAAATGSLSAIDDLEDAFPSEAHQAGVAYAQAADFVAWLQVSYGTQALESLLAASLDGQTLDQALFEATGQTSGQLDAAYMGDRKRSGIEWRAWLGPNMVWWVTAVFAVLVLVVVRRRHRRRYLAIKAEEAQHEALLASIWSGSFFTRGGRNE